MTYYAFTASHPDRAARELREHGYDAFAVMTAEYVKVSGHLRKTTKSNLVIRVAINRYVFGKPPNDSLNLWALSKSKYVKGVVATNGRPSPIRDREIENLLDMKIPLFRDDNVPTEFERRAKPRQSALVAVGDVVRFKMASQYIQAPVTLVNERSIRVKMEGLFLGRDEITLPIEMVDVA